MASVAPLQRRSMRLPPEQCCSAPWTILAGCAPPPAPPRQRWLLRGRYLAAPVVAVAVLVASAMVIAAALEVGVARVAPGERVLRGSSRDVGGARISPSSKQLVGGRLWGARVRSSSSVMLMPCIATLGASRRCSRTKLLFTHEPLIYGQNLYLLTKLLFTAVGAPAHGNSEGWTHMTKK